MTAYSTILATVAARGKGATGADLKRLTYTGRMAGSQWRTLAGYMIDAQHGTCAVCGGTDLKRARAASPDSVAMMTLLPASYFGTPEARAALGGDPYRVGYCEGNVVVAHVDCGRMVRGEKATASRLAITPDMILTVWDAAMTRKAKPLKPRTSDAQRRAAQARGWEAKG